MAKESAKCETLEPFCFRFALACEMTFITILTHSTESRYVIGPEKLVLQARPYVFQPGSVTGWDSEGVKQV